MVLTGKQALDYSGGVSAEDNFGIGGYERVMGPNGQAQYWAPDLAGACQVLLAYYENTYVAPGERFPRRATSDDPVDRDVRSAPHDGARLRPADGRRDLLRGDQPGPQEAVRHPRGDARGGRPGPPAARALGGDARGGDRGGVGRPARRLAGGDARDRVAPAAALRLRARRRARAVDLGHAVPAGLEEDRARDQRGVRAAAARRARQPRGLRRLAGVDAPAPARVRRRDRPRDRQLRRPDRVLRDLALPRRRVRGLLAQAERRAGDDRARGRARVGDRRRAGGGGRVRARGRRPRPQGPADRRARRADRRRRGRRAPAAAAPSATLAGRRCGRRSWASWPAEFDAHPQRAARGRGRLGRPDRAGRGAALRADREHRARHAPRRGGGLRGPLGPLVVRDPARCAMPARQPLGAVDTTRPWRRRRAPVLRRRAAGARRRGPRHRTRAGRRRAPAGRSPTRRASAWCWREAANAPKAVRRRRHALVDQRAQEHVLGSRRRSQAYAVLLWVRAR